MGGKGRSRATASADAHAQALLELVRAIGDPECTLSAAWHHLTEAAAHGLSAARVGIWLYDEHRTAIHCVDLYQSTPGSHEDGAVLERKDYPTYFAALATERTVAANDAEKDPRTREFTASYLRPLGIRAMLDVPIHDGGEVVGVICHEHVGDPRVWSHEEQRFAGSIGDLAGRAIVENRRRAAERSLREREENFRLLTENVSDLVAGLDDKGNFTYASPSHRELGVVPDDLIGRSAFERIHPDDAQATIEAFRSALATVGSATAVFRYRHSDGSYQAYEGTGRAFRGSDGVVRAVVTSRNVTERQEAERTARELQAQLSQAQRLEALGRLAGGIAHDFNNLLTAILGHLEVALASERADEALREELVEASKVVMSAADLTRALLALGRNQATEPEVLGVNEVVESLARMVRRVIGEDVLLELELDPQLPPVRIARTQFDQVLMNLAINSRDAMPEGGRLQVITRLLRPGEPAPSRRVRLGPGAHACVEVRDTGGGMDEATRMRVFDPFFTTKAVGKGVGLGLSTVYQIVREAGGVIEVESSPGEGTRVVLCFPAAAEQARPIDEPARRQARDVAGSERLLVVEDEESVRRLLERALRAQGYEVESAGDGREALERLAALDGRVDLVLSDVVMPVMGGVELARHMERNHPNVKLMLLSGYAPPGDGDSDSALFRSDRVLQKPFTTQRLLERVRAVLEEAGA